MARPAHLFASFVLALIAIVRLPVPWALCTAPDGHRAIEPMYASCCHEQPHVGDDDCCGTGCTDTPLSGDPTIRSADPDRALVAVAATIPLEIAAPVVASRAGIHAVAALRSPPPRPQHTTVIIC